MLRVRLSIVLLGVGEVGRLGRRRVGVLRGGEVGLLGGVGVGVFAFESILRNVCSAIIRIRKLWSSAANFLFSSFSLYKSVPLGQLKVPGRQDDLLRSARESPSWALFSRHRISSIIVQWQRR